MSAIQDSKRRAVEMDISLPLKRNFKTTLEGDTESEEEGFKIYCSTPPQSRKRLKTSSIKKNQEKDGGEMITPEK